MRILLDECIDRRLAPHLIGHEVQTVPQAGWASKKNGELLALASADYDVFVTVDRGIEFHQDVTAFNIVFVVLHAHSNRIADLLALVPELLSILPQCVKGQIIRVGDV